MASYTVKAPLLIAKDERGADVYAYQGMPLPGSVKGEQVQRFLDEDFITEDGKADEAERSDSDEQPRRRAAKKSASADA